jgi:hypothetical protein
MTTDAGLVINGVRYEARVDRPLNQNLTPP